MGSVDNGSQTLTYDFKQDVISEGFNKLNYQLHPKGIYRGGLLARVSDVSITLAPMLCLYEDNTNKVSVRIETIADAVIAVEALKPYIVGRFSWVNSENNFMDFLAVEAINLLATDIVFGKLNFTGATLTTTIDYSKKTWSSNYYLGMNIAEPLKVTAGDPYDNFVKVAIGGPYFFNNKLIEVASPQTSPEFSFPVSSNGRKDVVCIDSLDSSIVIKTGVDLAGAPLPNIGSEYLPIAIVDFPPSTLNTVKGQYITYIHPLKFLNSSINNSLVTKSTNYTISDTEVLDTVICTSAITVVLPHIANVSVGKKYTIKNNSSGNVVINTQDGTLLDISTSNILTSNESLDVVSIGISWVII